MTPNKLSSKVSTKATNKRSSMMTVQIIPEKIVLFLLTMTIPCKVSTKVTFKPS
jgi:hypothetical protein